jgi:VDE lipocalin domain
MAIAEGMEWAVFYYAGAASAAGITYRGALICTATGQLPRSDGALQQIEVALGKCSIRMWEMYEVNNLQCANAPLSVPEYGSTRWQELGAVAA